jgi:hypothetical protein
MQRFKSCPAGVRGWIKRATRNHVAQRLSRRAVTDLVKKYSTQRVGEVRGRRAVRPTDFYSSSTPSPASDFQFDRTSLSLKPDARRISVGENGPRLP